MTQRKRADLKQQAHAAWQRAHDSGQTRHGRLLARGGRHPDKRKQSARRACRGRVER